MAKDPASVAARWQQGVASSGQKMTDGINAVSVAPGAAAARQADVWANNTINAKDKWKRNVAGVSLQDWQAAMINKGVGRVSAGATAAVPKFTSFLQAFLPFQEQAVAALPPRGDLEANIARATSLIRATAKFRKPA